ncbi:MAG: helix-turn-helix domain-containing protein [Lachnospiraceae bacterium]|jgi:transcriptional regulator with XRE-family HTH domain|nr:helix-turn-helix domain-containing protein [Lachnospiraceae bacterium]
MTFGEKILKLRKQKRISQSELGDAVGVTMRTVRGWEQEGRFPKQNGLYKKLADVLGCDVAFLMDDGASFVTSAAEQYGARGMAQAEQLVSQLGGMFAGGELTESDKQAVFEALQEAYWDAKMSNRRYAPGKNAGPSAVTTPDS